MATIGQLYNTPDTGYNRFDMFAGSLFSKSTDTWTKASYGLYNNSPTSSSYITLKISGTKFRIFNYTYGNRCNLRIYIDDVLQSDILNCKYNNGTGDNVLTLIYESPILTNGIHTITLIMDTTSSGSFIFRGVDVLNGGLAHPILNQVSDITTMQIGDCIPCRYTASTSGSAGYFSELGTCMANEISLAGTATPDGLFYFIKTDKGTLIADRVVQTSISWDTLNTTKFIEGVKIATNKTNLTPTVSINGCIATSDSCYVSYDTTKSLSTGNGIWWTLATPPTGGHWWKLDLGINNNQAINTITWTAVLSGSPSSYSIKNFIIWGSNDDINYIQLYSGTQQNNNSAQTHIFNNNTKYRYYKFTFPGGDYLGSNYCGFTQLQLYSSIISFICSLSGGVAYLDTNGNLSTTNKNLGAWPANNEWDSYIVNSDLNGKIAKGDDNVWHYNTSSTSRSWTKDTCINGIAGNTNRIGRGSCIYGGTRYNSQFDLAVSSLVNSAYGFRPVLNYIETDIASEVIY